MQLQRTNSAWTCLPASFATVLGITLEDLLKRIGHDGSEVIWNYLPDPEKRRGFHPQEMIDVAETMGVAITPIEGRPTSRPLLTDRTRPRCPVPPFEVPLDIHPRWGRYLEGSVGVLTGLNLIGRPHAVVWDGFQILDPASGETYGSHLFQPDIFWRARVMGPPLRTD